MLDSGAQGSVAGVGFSKIINKLNLKANPTNTTISTADGTSHKIPYSYSFPITYNGVTKELTVLHSENVEQTLILGIDFWNLFHIKTIVCDSIETTKQIPTTENHDLTIEHAQELQKILKEMPFSKEGILSKTDLITHRIDTGIASPIKQRHYVVSPYIQSAINIEIDRLISLDVIESCDPGPWSSPIVAVKKPSGKVRLCLDARKLNDITVKDAYPQQQINRILGRLRGTKVLSSIDFSDAFLQIGLDVDSQMKTAFAISGRGYFKYKRMAFGLCNSGATLCRLVDRVIGCDLEPYVFVYLDDIIIATSSFEHHFEVLSMLAKRISTAKLTISLEKSRFCMRSLKYLGFIISEKGIQPDLGKIEAIRNYPEPKNIKGVRRLIGLAGWYSRFIPNYSTIISPITDLLKKSKSNGKFQWTVQASDALKIIVDRLTSEPVLANADYSKPFTIQADASDVGIGAILVQGEKDDEHVVAYFSQKLSSAQRKYQTTERECLAVIHAIDKFRPYIEGVKFTVITDHASLLWLRNLKDPCGRLGRWALRLQAHDFELKHRKGRFMVVADALSRMVETVDLIKDSSDTWYNKLMTNVKDNPIKFPDFRIRDSYLYKYCAMAKKNYGYSYTWRLVVPSDDRFRIFVKCHNDPLSSHGGYFKTADRIKREYYWPSMDSDIRKFVRECVVCNEIKPSNLNQVSPMGNFRETTRPWEAVSIDFVGPLPRSKSGFSFILLVSDMFSKFVHLQPLRSATSQSTIKCLEEHIFLQFGTPRFLISDNGSQFVSREFKAFLQSYDVKHWLTARYHPQANSAEAANKTAETCIRAYLRDQKSHKEWDRHLVKIACAMNTSKHTSTQFSPYYTNFGQHMCTSGKDYVNIANNVDDHVNSDEHFANIRRLVKQNLKKTHETSKKRYDLRSRNIQYNVGDTVYRKVFSKSDATKHQIAKFNKKFIRCRVVRKVGTNCYELSDPDGNLGIYSTSHLKAFK